MKVNKYKVGDRVVARLFGGTRKEGTIEDIEWDEDSEEYIADLDCGNWCYLDQIIKKL